MKCLLHILPVAIALILGMAACGDSSCFDNGSSLPLATIHLGEQQQTVSGITIKGIGVPGDELLVDSASISEVYLPLRASVSTTSFEFSRVVYQGAVPTLYHDTITFNYTPVEFFHSAECGAMYNFDIKQVTSTCHAIDSVVILTTQVTNSRTPAMRIYLTEFTL